MVLPEHNDAAILKQKIIRAFSSPVFICLLLAATTLCIFWPVTHCDFLNYDDPDYFTSNPRVLSGLNFGNVAWAFTTGHASNWHPLTWLSLMLDADLFGKNSFGPHFTNLVFHTANTVLLFLWLRRLTAAIWRSAMVAALFALHPLHVESVAWVAERKDVFSTFFGLAALLVYTRYAQRQATVESLQPGGAGVVGPAPGFCFLNFDCFLSLIFFTFSLLAKPMLVTFPFLLLLLDFWPLQRSNHSTVRRRLIEKTPFFILSAASCIVTFIVQQKGGAVVTLTKFSLPARIENAFVSYARYLGKTFWPASLADPYPPPGTWGLSWVVFSTALILGLSIFAIWRSRKFPFVFTGWFWLVGMLVPVIGLVQVGDAAMADRYTYFPLIGLFIVLIWSANEICRRWPALKPLLIFFATIVLVASAVRTRGQLSYWQNSGTLFSHTLAVTANNYVACNDLGTWLSANGDVAEAMNFFRQSLEIKADNPDALYNLGNAFAKSGNWTDAISNYQQALQYTPDQPDILSNLGFALAETGQFPAAIVDFESALKLNPHYADAENNLATVFFMQRRFDEAAQHYRAALRLTPDNAQLYANLGDALVRQGQIAEAMKNYQLALRFKPDDERVKAKLRSLGR